MSMSKLLVFGYGSLMSKESLRATVPDVSDIRPAYIEGFVRDFSLWDPEGFTETNRDIRGIPFCAVDVKQAEGKSHVNGIVFSVDETYFKALRRREQEYALVSTTAYNFESGKPLGECKVFSANKNNGNYDFGSIAQGRYLQVCLEGAAEYGKKFYAQFLETTYINNQTLGSVLKDLK